ncbi:MAG: hypothetical protein D6677_08805 [Calditrichaeota bacterium]|nr:MAG: hypothetical protein D6677_08805 [Calditrichota bacterium]
MQRIAFDVDPIAIIRNTLGGNEPDPVNATLLAEIGGAESIVCYFRDDEKTVTARDVRLLNELVKTHFNVRVNLTEERIRALIAMKVPMVTFVAPGDVHTLKPETLSLANYVPTLQNYIAELRSNGILTSALIAPELSEVKAASKLELDYIEIDASVLDEAEDMASEIDFLDKLNGLLLAAGKLGLGINISGGIGYDNLRDIAALEYIEDIVVAEPVVHKSLYIGMEHAIRDLQSML